MVQSRRRVTFSVLVLASQLLFIALAVAWLIQMIVIALNGSVQFVENNRTILLVEVVLTALILIYAVTVFVIQVRRLGERRRGEERETLRRTTDLEKAKNKRGQRYRLD